MTVRDLLEKSDNSFNTIFIDYNWNDYKEEYENTFVANKVSEIDLAMLKSSVDNWFFEPETECMHIGCDYIYSVNDPSEEEYWDRYADIENFSDKG